jgi:hypothetical protein
MFPVGGDVISGAADAWSGSVLGVMVTTSTTKDLVRFAADGTLLGRSTLATNDNLLDTRRLLWAGDRFVLAWIEMSTNTLNVQEASIDGVPGTRYTIHSGSADVGGAPFNIIEGFVANAATYALQLGQYTGGTPTYLLIDRASGQLAHFAAPLSNYDNAQLLERDSTSFGIYAARLLEFHVLDTDGVSATGPTEPAAGVPDVLHTPAGYQAWGFIQNAQPATMTVTRFALDHDGNPLSTPTPTFMYAADQSYSTPGGTSRANGFVTMAEYGSSMSMTVRLVQECAP